MENFNTLIGRFVRIYQDQHIVEGKIEFIDEEKLILNNNDTYLMVFKSKVNTVVLNPNDKEIDGVYEYSSNLEQTDKDEVVSKIIPETAATQQEQEKRSNFTIETNEMFKQNTSSSRKGSHGEESSYGSFLPKTLITQQPVDPIEIILDNMFSEEDIVQEDFSISMSTLNDQAYLLSRAEREKILKDTEEK